MGLRENFSQAVKELTGGGREEPKKYVEGMKKAVAENDDTELRADGRSVKKNTTENNIHGAPFSKGSERTDTMRPQPGELNFNIKNIPKNDASQYTDDEFDLAMGSFTGNTGNETSGTENITGIGESFFGAPTPVQESIPEPQEKIYNQYEYERRTSAAEKIREEPPRDSDNERTAEQIYENLNKYTSSYQTPPDDRERRNRPIEPEDSSELTVISRNTVVTGNIRSFANMSIDGNIKGNIDTTKNIDLNGNVEGNLTCNNASMRIAQVKGNLQMKGSVSMQSDTILVGDLNSTYADINGKIQGNIDVAGKAEFKKDSVIFGDISASLITVAEGAVIKGYVDTTFLSKEESKNIFPDNIAISDL